MSDQRRPGDPPGSRRSPDGTLFRRKTDGSWWWQASDGNWYPAQLHPSYRPPPPPPPPPAPSPPLEPTAVFSIPQVEPFPRRAWTTFRGWPRAAQLGLAAGLVVLVIAVVTPKDDAPKEVLSAGRSTLLTPSTRAKASPTTAELVLPKASTTIEPTAAPPTTHAAVAAAPTTTEPPVTDPPSTEASAPTEEDCDPSYPDFCIPHSPPDLDCGDIPHNNFQVLLPDPHRLDGNPKNGIGCED